MPNRFNDHIDDGFSPYSNDEMWDLLNIYADGEASVEEAARVEAMLRSDASYARQFAFVKTATAAVQSFSELDPPSSLRDAILASTTQRESWTARLVWLRDAVQRSLAPRFATSLVGLAAAGLLAFVVVQHNAGRFRNGIVADTMNVRHPSVAANSGPGQLPASAYDDTNIVLPPDESQVAVGTYRPDAPPQRLHETISAVRADWKITRVAVVSPPANKPKTQIAHHEDSTGVVVAVAYRPDMDAQFERNPGSVAASETQPVEIPGDDVHIADADPTPAVAPAHPTSDPVAPTTTASHADGPHIIVAKLTALPPDPNQVMTRADMARNRAALTSGYDRSTLRSMERKETSISILRGSF
jgi:hypothetical protein